MDLLYVARHGQTQWNVEKLVSSRTDIPLTALGYQQAKRLAKEVAETQSHITKILYSPLTRAKETARIVAEYNHLTAKVDERLSEVNFGDFEGVIGSQKDFQKAKLELALRFPNGESMMDAYARVVPLLQEVLSDKQNTYLLICHHSLIRLIKNYFEPSNNEDFFSFEVPNATLISFL